MELIEDIQRRNLHKSAKRVETEGFFQLQRIEELSSPFVGFYEWRIRSYRIVLAQSSRLV